MSHEKRGKTLTGEKSRIRIIAETRLLLAEADLHSLKLDDIAARSGVAKSSILWHFGSKNGLLLAVVDDIFQNVQTWIASIDSKPLQPREYLTTCMARLADGFAAHPEANALLISFITNKTIDPAIRERVRFMYAQYRAFITNIPGATAPAGNSLDAAVILAFIDGAFLQWYLEPETIDLKNLLLRGVELCQ